jgi:hypothetical protein
MEIIAEFVLIADYTKKNRVLIVYKSLLRDFR